MSIRYSAIGDLPVPPTAILPMHITGKLKLTDLNIFLSKK
jgi:hypothetical protein